MAMMAPKRLDKDRLCTREKQPEQRRYMAQVKERFPCRDVPALKPASGIIPRLPPSVATDSPTRMRHKWIVHVRSRPYPSFPAFPYIAPMSEGRGTSRFPMQSASLLVRQFEKLTEIEDDPYDDQSWQRG